MKKWRILILPSLLLICLFLFFSDIPTKKNNEHAKAIVTLAADSSAKKDKKAGGDAKAAAAPKAAAEPKDDNKPQKGPVDTTPEPGSGGVGSINSDGTTDPAESIDDVTIPNGGASTVPPRSGGSAKPIDPNKIPIPNAGSSTEKYF
jgi:hypothetical protein